LGRLLYGIPKEENRKSEGDEAGHRELHGFLQDGWRIPQRASQKADQHHRRKPQHRRVEEPFLRRLRHSITNRLARRLDWSSIAACAPPFQASTLADFRGSAQDTRVDAGMAWAVQKLPGGSGGGCTSMNVYFVRIDGNR